MKNLIFPLLLVAFAYGCNDEDASTTNDSNIDQSILIETHTTPLTILKTYDEEIGQLEAYYINEQLTETTGEEDIHITVTSVEYGKVLIKEENRGIYEDIVDADGKNTYIKIGITIDGNFDHFKDKTFFAYQSELEIMEIITQADSTYSDQVKFEGEAVSVPLQGFLYFITDAALPIEKAKLITPAPFHNRDGLSISLPYEIDLNLITQ